MIFSREEKTIDEKLDEELVGVGDEGALKKTIGSDLESSSDEDEDNNDNAEIEEEEKPRTVIANDFAGAVTVFRLRL